MSLRGKKIAVLAAPGYEDSELTEPVAALSDAGAEVILIGLSAGDRQGIRGKHGTVVMADATIVDADASGFDALVIPGGKSPAHLRRDGRVLDFVRGFDNAGKPIAAICHGPQVLASAGLLRGRQATSYYKVRDEVIGAGGKYIDAPVVEDGNLITSRKPGDIPQFNAALIGRLEES